MRYAETWLDVGRYPLRRRDRAAMVLALEAVRAGFHESAIGNVLKTGGTPCLSVWAAMEDVGSWVLEPRREVEFRRRQDLILARLALLLRVLLRVDAEREAYGSRSVGCWWADCRRCEGSGAHSAQWLGIDCPACNGDAVELAPLVIRPLWEAAR